MSFIPGNGGNIFTSMLIKERAIFGTLFNKG